MNKIHKMINESTHTFENSLFYFTTKLGSGFRCLSTLRKIFHHQIVYAKFNLKIHFPPFSERKIWHYGQGNPGLIKRAVNEFDWQRRFSNLYTNERVSFLNKTTFNSIKFYST